MQNGHLSIRKAAIEFDVPKTTLHDTLKEKYQDAGMPGRKPALPVNIENRIANALKEASRQGMGVSRLQDFSTLAAMTFTGWCSKFFPRLVAIPYLISFVFFQIKFV
jgi:hypothetical protein